MKKILLISFMFSFMPFVSGCDDTNKENVQNEQVQEAQNRAQPQSTEEMRSVINNRLEAWMGKWDGPEGTYLNLEKSGDGYAVIIKDLDSEQRYLGVAQSQAMGINFTRNGIQETLTEVPGYMTDMKWLQDKPVCLMVKKSEAFCRDKS